MAGLDAARRLANDHRGDDTRESEHERHNQPTAPSTHATKGASCQLNRLDLYENGPYGLGGQTANDRSTRSSIDISTTRSRKSLRSSCEIER